MSKDNLIESDQTSLKADQLVGILRRRGLWILLSLVVFAGVAYGYSQRKTKKYTATAAIVFSDNQLDNAIAGLPAGGSAVSQIARQASNRELVKLGDMAVKTARLLGHGLTAATVSASVSVGGQTESSIVTVSATSTSPAVAADIANTYVGQFVKEQQSTNRQYFKSALALVDRQLAKLSTAQRFGSDGLDLQVRAHTLGLLAELNYNNAQVAQEALVPSSPSSPKTKRNTILGAVLGLLVGLGIAFLLEGVDRRIREPEDLEAIYRVPMLGAVPKSAALSRSARHDGAGEVASLPPAEAEAFSLVRAHLRLSHRRFHNVDRDMRTLVIASPTAGDGKTTIARHLAEAAARLGSRVLLLEVDLRHPTLSQQLNIGSSPGLADVLVGAVPMSEAVQSAEVQAPPGEGVKGRTLDVLVAGTVAPNPGELIESRAMDVLLEQARATYDLVVIDTPPLTAVSDAFPLLTKVDGVVIVGRVGQSRRDDAEHLQQVLNGSGAPLLGVIANGSKSSSSSAYFHPARNALSPTATSASDTSSSEEFMPTAKS